MKRSRLYLIVLVSVALLAGCNSEPAPPGPTERAETPQTTSLPMADPPLNREAMLLAVARAASDWAAGLREVQRQRELDGKRFELRLRFGCPTDNIDSRQWSFDEQERVLRAEVEHEISAQTRLLAELGLDQFEAAEGFWVHRPWLLEAGCPARERRPESSEGQPVAQRAARTVPELSDLHPAIGIAQFYTEEDSRTARRATRAYEATITLDEGEAPSSQGYDLVLSGRLARLSDGRVIACTGRSDTPPSCVISVRFDHVALARPDGEILAQWSSG